MFNKDKQVENTHRAIGWPACVMLVLSLFAYVMVTKAFLPPPSSVLETELTSLQLSPQLVQLMIAFEPKITDISLLYDCARLRLQ